MFKWLKERRSLKKTSAAMKDDPLMGALLDHTKKNWHDVGILANSSPEFTQRQMEEFFTVVERVKQSENPTLALREYLVNAISVYASFLTLCITPEYKDQMFTSESQFVSGELNQHLGDPKAKDLVPQFKELFFNYPDSSANDLQSIADFQMALFNFYILGFDLVRLHLGDFNKANPERDWLRPYKIAMAEIEEYEHRETLQLPQLLEKIDMLNRRIFTQKVLTDANPLMSYAEFMEKQDRE